MTASETAMIENLLREFGTVLDSQTGMPVHVDVQNTTKGITARYGVTFSIAAFYPVTLDPVALKHVRDPVDFISEVVVDHGLRPFGEKVLAAGHAAAKAWEEAFDAR